MGGSVEEAILRVGQLRRLCGGWSKADNNATLWLHLTSWSLQISQLSLKSRMEPSVAIYVQYLHINFTIYAQILNCIFSHYLYNNCMIFVKYLNNILAQTCTL